MSLDKNGDGSLTLEELREGLKGKENGETLLEIMKSADTDGSGEINYTEFIAATIDQTIFLREDYLRTAFDMFDKDGSGRIDNDEVIALLAGDDLKHLISKDSIKQAMSEIDENGDGEIDFAEFMEMMKKCTQLG